jgi:DNA-binding IclR family transcriptional regulator
MPVPEVNEWENMRTPAGHDGRLTPGVQSPRRVLQMLLRFSEQRPQATIGELAHEVGAPLSTAYRYVALLRELGLLEETSDGAYRVGPRIQAVARASARTDTLARRARPSMEDLTATLGETTMLVRVIANSAVCVERVESNRAVRLSVQPGQPLPLYTGASGKTLLAFLPAAESDRLLRDSALTDPDLRATLPQLRDELSQIAEQGWAESHGEIDDGIWACAAVLRLPGEPLAALSLAGPEYRIDPPRREHIRGELLRTSRELGDIEP